MPALETIVSMARNKRPYRCLGDFGIWSAQNVRWIG
jgi:hypothetical protein